MTCDHDPVEQVRSQMGSGDYFDAVTNSLDEPRFARLPENYHEFVELDATNQTDMRVVCRKCFLSTGWMKVDAPGMPAGIGIPAVKSKWDEIKQYDAEEWNAIQRARAVRSQRMSFGGTK